jgi:hypothetical protein
LLSSLEALASSHAVYGQPWHRTSCTKPARDRRANNTTRDFGGVLPVSIGHRRRRTSILSSWDRRGVRGRNIPLGYADDRPSRRRLPRSGFKLDALFFEAVEHDDEVAQAAGRRFDRIANTGWRLPKRMIPECLTVPPCRDQRVELTRRSRSRAGLISQSSPCSHRRRCCGCRRFRDRQPFVSLCRRIAIRWRRRADRRDRGGRC